MAGIKGLIINLIAIGIAARPIVVKVD